MSARLTVLTLVTMTAFCFAAAPIAEAALRCHLAITQTRDRLYNLAR